MKKLIDGFLLVDSSSNPSAPVFAPAHVPSEELLIEQEVEQEVERYRQQLLLEKTQASKASSAKGSGAG